MPSLKLSNPFRRGADRPSLRERAAALKATAGRVMLRKSRSSTDAAEPMARPATESEGIKAVPEVRVSSASPALTEMVEAWQALAVEIESANVTEKEVDALTDRHIELQIAICRFPAATAADLLAKVPVFHDEMRDAVSGLNPDFKPEDTLSGAAWLGLFRDFKRLADAAIPDTGDAALIALGIELDAAREREADADRDYEARADAAAAAVPERPVCLTFRESDHPFKLRQSVSHPAAMEGLPVDFDDVAWMRRAPIQHQVLRDARPGERGWSDYGGKVPEMQPWPEAQARADEIVAAWVAWRDAIHTVDVEHGIVEAEARGDQIGEEITTIVCRIAAIPSHTVEGMSIKLRAARYGLGDIRSTSASARVLRSLMRDAGVPASEMED